MTRLDHLYLNDVNPAFKTWLDVPPVLHWRQSSPQNIDSMYHLYFTARQSSTQNIASINHNSTSWNRPLSIIQGSIFYLCSIFPFFPPPPLFSSFLYFSSTCWFFFLWSKILSGIIATVPYNHKERRQFLPQIDTKYINILT